MRRRAFNFTLAIIILMGMAFSTISTVQRANAAGPDEVAARIKTKLEQAASGKELGLVFTRYDKSHKPLLDIRINDKKRYPVASSFKLFLVLDYYLNMPEKDVDESSVYSVAVFSNNGKTSWLLSDLAKLHPEKGNAIVQFNDFLASIGLHTGLYSWDFDRTLGMSDERFAPVTQGVDIHGKHQVVSNLFSAEDLAFGLRLLAQGELSDRWSDPVYQKAILKSRDVLSVPAYNYVSPLEKVLPDNAHFGKDGVLPTEQLGFRVLNDCMVMPMSDGGYWLISFMDSGEGDTTAQDFLIKVAESVNSFEAVVNPDNTLAVPADAVSAPIVKDQFNYGFVLPAQIDIYTQPKDDAPLVDNPWRTNLRLQTAYLMRGALVRFWPLDDEWARLVPDDPGDTAFNKQTVYVHISDLQVIDPEIKPIDFITKPGQKWVVVDIFHRTATLFEGTTIILKTPVILNTAETPRGHFYVRTRYLSRNMMPWVPSVPYTNFFDDEGHAIHGSPWHHWSDTVNQDEAVRRVTHGCINLPNWEVTVGNYTMPTDEFIYRWMGAMQDPTHNTFEPEKRQYQQSVAVYVVDNPDHLTDYALPDAAKIAGISWPAIGKMILDRQTDAPPSFFGHASN